MSQKYMTLRRNPFLGFPNLFLPTKLRQTPPPPKHAPRSPVRTRTWVLCVSLQQIRYHNIVPFFASSAVSNHFSRNENQSYPIPDSNRPPTPASVPPAEQVPRPPACLPLRSRPLPPPAPASLARAYWTKGTVGARV